MCGEFCNSSQATPTGCGRISGIPPRPPPTKICWRRQQLFLGEPPGFVEDVCHFLWPPTWIVGDSCNSS
eukprot:4451308-Prorocentrum_lima.AAC.1